MQTLDKASWLASLEMQVEHYIQEAVEDFQNLDEAILRRPSPTGGWSIAQCLAHLNSYGTYYLPYLQEGLAKQTKSQPGEKYVSSWLGAFLIKLMDPESSRVKFKAIRRHQPIDTLNPHSVVAAFIDQQELMLSLLKLARQREINTIKIPLSIARLVRLSVGDILTFLVVHTKRHLMQARRNK